MQECVFFECFDKSKTKETLNFVDYANLTTQHNVYIKSEYANIKFCQTVTSFSSTYLALRVQTLC